MDDVKNNHNNRLEKDWEKGSITIITITNPIFSISVPILQQLPMT